MLEMNPYPYDSVEYNEYELNAAKRNLQLVKEAAVVNIKNSTEKTACEVATEMFEAIMYATYKVECAQCALKRLKEKYKCK